MHRPLAVFLFFRSAYLRKSAWNTGCHNHESEANAIASSTPFAKVERDLIFLFGRNWDKESICHMFASSGCTCSRFEPGTTRLVGSRGSAALLRCQGSFHFTFANGQEGLPVVSQKRVFLVLMCVACGVFLGKAFEFLGTNCTARLRVLCPGVSFGLSKQDP